MPVLTRRQLEEIAASEGAASPGRVVLSRSQLEAIAASDDSPGQGAPPATDPRLRPPDAASAHAFAIEEPSLQDFALGSAARMGAGFMNLGTGAKQAFFEALEASGRIDSGTAAAYTSLTEKDRAEFDQAFDSRFGPSFFMSAMEFIGEAAPVMAVPGVGSGGLLARTAGGAAAGGISGGLQFVPEGESRAEKAVIGAATGAAVSPFVDVLSRARNFIRESLRPAIASSGERRGASIFAGPASREAHRLKEDFLARSRQLAGDGLKVFERASDMIGEEIPVKITNLTDDPVVSELERLARSLPSGERIAKQIEHKQVEGALKLWQKVLDVLDSGSGVGRFSARAQRAFTRATDDVLAARTSQAKRDFARVARFGTTDVPITNFRETLARLRAELDDQAGKVADRQRRELDGLIKEYDKLGGNVRKIESFQRDLQRFGQQAEGRGGVFTKKFGQSDAVNYSRALFAALQRDLDALIDSSSGGAAGMALRVARNNWRRSTEALNNIKESAVGRLFDVRRGKILTADQIDRKFLGMDAEDIKFSMEFLGRTDPQIKKRLQVLWVSSKLNQAQQSGKFDKVEFSPGRMFDLLREDETYNAVFDTEVDRELMRDAFDLTRRVVGNFNASVPSGIAPRLKEIGGLAGAQAATGVMSPVFFARALVSVLAPGALVNRTLTRRGIQATAASPPAQAPISSAAIAGAQAAQNLGFEDVSEFTGF